MKTIKLMTLLFGFYAVTLAAQQLPSHVEFKELGLSFDIPSGWQGQLTEETVLLGHNSIPGLMILTENQAKNAMQLKHLAMQGVVEGGIKLTPTDEFQLLGKNRVEGFYQGYFNGSEVKVFAIGLINGLGSGMNIIIITETDKFTNQHKVEANKLATSVKFFKSVDSATTTNWKQKISGNQLKYMHTSGSNDYDGGYTGVSDKVYIELCTNSSFYYYSSSQGSYEGSGGFGSAGNSNNNAGTYKISAHADQPYLTLNFANGEIYEYALSSNEQGNTFLDDRRYFVTDLESCY
ncbi:MAG: hypothetical protein L3J53_08165 [Proteobacteria bacterium]|nr:hypothetical protein [Pseudomonadota bacterium]